MKLVFFGTLIPLTERLASAGTGMAILLSRNPQIDVIDVFAQTGGRIPEGADNSKIHLKEPWEIDNPVSLLRAIAHLARERDSDVLFFNQSLTMFGRKKLSNVIGLLIPTIVAKWTRKPVVVYMHDFIETEEPRKLGYRAGPLSKATASFLERLLIANTTLIVPRQSQKTALEKKYRKHVRSQIIPYVEGIHGLVAASASEPPARQKDECVKVLLFGKWGPQKDLKGGLEILSDLMKDGCDFKVTIAGGINPNFPEFEGCIGESLRKFPAERVEYIGNVPEESVPDLFRSSDILFLPYLASGGYSGVMNLGALYGLRIIAYDSPQLRESDALIGASTLFISKDSPGANDEVRAAIDAARSGRRNSTTDMRRKLSVSALAMDDIVAHVISRARPSSGRRGKSAKITESKL